MIETKPSPCEWIIFLPSVHPLPHMVVELGLKLRKSVNFFHLLCKSSSLLKWITSQENQVETVQINSATQWTCEVTAYWHCTRKDQIQSIFWWKMSNITTHTKKGHVARILLIAGCFCLNGTRAYERSLSYRQLRVLTFP